VRSPRPGQISLEEIEYRLRMQSEERRRPYGPYDRGVIASAHGETAAANRSETGSSSKEQR
jgi:hypothetical protein